MYPRHVKALAGHTLAEQYEGDSESEDHRGVVSSTWTMPRNGSPHTPVRRIQFRHLDVPWLSE